MALTGRCLTTISWVLQCGEAGRVHVSVCVWCGFDRLQEEADLHPRYSTLHFSRTVRRAAGGWSTDIYSLGVVLFEMATGRPPFLAETPAGLGTRHMTEPPPPPHSIRSEVPMLLSNVILRCLEKNPSARYASAAALATDLRRSPNRARASRDGSGARKRRRRRRLLSACWSRGPG
jgi:serine/threonine protein kinase